MQAETEKNRGQMYGWTDYYLHSQKPGPITTSERGTIDAAPSEQAADWHDRSLPLTEGLARSDKPFPQTQADLEKQVGELKAQIQEERQNHARAMDMQTQDALTRQKQELIEHFEERRRTYMQAANDEIKELREENNALRSEAPEGGRMKELELAHADTMGNIRASHAAEIEGLRGCLSSLRSSHEEQLQVTSGERDRLRMRLDSIGEATDLKSNKEDSY